MGVIGIDHAQVRAWARDLDIELSLSVWRKIEALESATLSKLNKAPDK
jgi:hypothetical protein